MKIIECNLWEIKETLEDFIGADSIIITGEKEKFIDSIKFLKEFNGKRYLMKTLQEVESPRGASLLHNQINEDEYVILLKKGNTKIADIRHVESHNYKDNSEIYKEKEARLKEIKKNIGGGLRT